MFGAMSAPSASRVFQFFCRSSTFTAPFAGFCPSPVRAKPARDRTVKPFNQLRRSIFVTSVGAQYRRAYRPLLRGSNSPELVGEAGEALQSVNALELSTFGTMARLGA